MKHTQKPVNIITPGASVPNKTKEQSNSGTYGAMSFKPAEQPLVNPFQSRHGELTITERIRHGSVSVFTLDHGG